MSSNKILKLIKEKEIEYVDLRFTDPKGKLQHVTMDKTVVDDEMLNEGIFFDGSSIAGWKAINESDMILKPDTGREVIDPFASHNTLVLFCDVLDAVKKTPYERDPRSTAKKAAATADGGAGRCVREVMYVDYRMWGVCLCLCGIKADNPLLLIG